MENSKNHGMIDNVYEVINTGKSIDKLPWDELFNSMYTDWLKRKTECTPIPVLQRYLFDVQSYSKRLLCLSKLQDAAYAQIKDDSHAQEWNEEFSSYIRYNERLRELKDNGYEVIPQWDKKVTPMDEISLLMENLTPEELVAYTALAKQIYELNQKKKSKYSLFSYSLIFRSSSSAKVGAMSIFEFSREFICMEKYRSKYIARRTECVPSIIPISRKHCEQCIEIYIRERIKHIREELLAADDTRPTPDDKECMKIMHEQDKKIVQLMSTVHEDGPIMDMLFMMASKIKKFDTEDIALGKEGMNRMVRMMQTYLQCLEKKINETNTPSVKMQSVQYNGPVYYGTVNNITNNFATPTETEDVQSIAEPTEDPIESVIFTPKARHEHKEAVIIQSLTKSIAGRKDKTRAFVQELKSWQESEYVDAHFNAQVMFDELSKILPIPFGYEVFKKHYNNTRA